jgi:hypothetical protein
MRLGKVKIQIEYVVDLDDEEMVQHAFDALYEDLCGACKYDSIHDVLEITEEDPSLKQEDIPEFLLDTAE